MDTKAEFPVVVTGGAGCLGQHVIKLLQTKADHVTEIRVLDKIQYENRLGHKETKPVISTCGDVSDLDVVCQIVRGVKSVFHLASLVSVSTFPDNAGMERINVDGTRAVIEACVREGVGNLIYCSSVEVVVGLEDIVDAGENDVRTPKTFVHEGYARTKMAAENMVLEANGCQLDTGGVLNTASLRPYVFYGEQDRHYIPTLLKQVRKTGGILIQTGTGNAIHQHAYVGNNAWAFICAERALRKNPKAASGEAYFITDDSPEGDMYSQTDPFLKEKGMRLSSFRIPFLPIYIFVYLVECLIWFLSPLVKIDIGFTSDVIRFLNVTVKVKRDKAKNLLGYFPLYSVEESMRNACSYYRDIEI